MARPLTRAAEIASILALLVAVAALLLDISKSSTEGSSGPSSLPQVTVSSNSPTVGSVKPSGSVQAHPTGATPSKAPPSNGGPGVEDSSSEFPDSLRVRTASAGLLFLWFLVLIAVLFLVAIVGVRRNNDISAFWVVVADLVVLIVWIWIFIDALAVWALIAAVVIAIFAALLGIGLRVEAKQDE
ncbi:hypothetical protein [Planotetraspora sp. GP83]|uniref:hypothetical protein n=1 Tax=Planotetraspora sp. GP83 TaxID=3156264 RepID=UPI0035162393